MIKLVKKREIKDERIVQFIEDIGGKYEFDNLNMFELTFRDKTFYEFRDVTFPDFIEYIIEKSYERGKEDATIKCIDALYNIN